MLYIMSIQRIHRRMQLKSFLCFSFSVACLVNSSHRNNVVSKLFCSRPRHKYPEKCSKNLSGNSQFFPKNPSKNYCEIVKSSK